MLNEEIYLLCGLGKIGTAITKNLSKKGYQVVGFDENPNALQKFKAASIVNSSIAVDLNNMLAFSPNNRRILICVPEGEGLDALVDYFSKNLNETDLLVDLGNSHFQKTALRHAKLKKKKIRFCDVGVSGGPSMAEIGPSLMCGSDENSWPDLAKVVSILLGKPISSTRLHLIGSPGSGHFVKMLHNAIEYCIMQIIGESLVLADKAFNGCEWAQFHKHLRRSLVGGYLLDLTLKNSGAAKGSIFESQNMQKNKVSHNGTGVWAAQYALQNNIAFPSLNRALEHRLLSVHGYMYQSGSKIMPPHRGHPVSHVKKVGQKRLIDCTEMAFLSVFIQGIRCIDLFARCNDLNFSYSKLFKVWQDASVLRGNMVTYLQGSLGSKKTGFLLKRNNHFDDFLGARANSVSAFNQDAYTLGNFAPVINSAFDFLIEHPDSQKVSGLLNIQRSIFGGHII